MLIEFSVSNFRSFRERQTFSMVAAPKLRKKENVFVPVVKGEKIPALLKVAAIYGPNASGKSNLLKAMRIVRDIVDNPASEPLPAAPFRFDPLLAELPSRFEFHFICEEQRYKFDLAMKPERIVEERLTAFPMGKETLLYERLHTENGEQYRFGPQLEGGELVHQAWRDLTGPKMLFIKQAVANSREALKQLRIPFEWQTTGVVVCNEGMSRLASGALALARTKPLMANRIVAFLGEIDVPVSEIKFKKMSDPESSAIFIHTTALGSASFELDDESDGTKNLIGFWMPWVLMGSDISSRAGLAVVAVDELDSSLHPKIVATLIEQHLQDEQPPQLIFTTHDTHLMDTKLLRRDQFWLTERDKNGATQLRSIHDFEGRESEDLEKRYYEGRYRALPILRRSA
jgi:hypothetical protein